MDIIERLMSLVKTQNAEEFIESMVTCFAAPVIQGVKCGKLLNLRRGGSDLSPAWSSVGRGLLDGFSLEAAEVPTGGKGLLLLIYDRELLARALDVPAARAILEGLGYPVRGGSLDDRIAYLLEKFRSGLPHEVGLFLGYPPDDVQGFIQNGGRGSKLAGYWKVYGDETEAKRTFLRYRRAEVAGAMSLLERAGLALPGAPGLNEGLTAF